MWLGIMVSAKCRGTLKETEVNIWVFSFRCEGLERGKTEEEEEQKKEAFSMQRAVCDTRAGGGT